MKILKIADQFPLNSTGRKKLAKKRMLSRQLAPRLYHEKYDWSKKDLVKAADFDVVAE
ncbi:MAG TPA: hypothetical protein VJM47_05050 [Nitrosospira sp.]|nr:hypothetical protein [Nitrosospira sp.]